MMGFEKATPLNNMPIFVVICGDTVDGSEIPNNHCLDVPNPVNNGINYYLSTGECRISEWSTVFVAIYLKFQGWV